MMLPDVGRHAISHTRPADLPQPDVAERAASPVQRRLQAERRHDLCQLVVQLVGIDQQRPNTAPLSELLIAGQANSWSLAWAYTVSKLRIRNHLASRPSMASQMKRIT
jgi:hypothetical protein